MILPYIDQAPLYNSSNVLGYPGWAGPYIPRNPAGLSTAPNENLYNMDWCNTTVRSTRLAVFVCPTDPNNGADNFFYTPSDYSNYPQYAPMDRQKGIPLTNWARGNYGAIQGDDRSRPPDQWHRRPRSQSLPGDAEDRDDGPQLRRDAVRHHRRDVEYRR